MAFNRKNIVALAALLGTLWAVIATSESKGTFAGSYFVSSDCVTPTREGAVLVSNNQVVGGSATSFTDFGFPSATVTRDADVTGMVGAAQRVCSPTYADKDTGTYIYSCFDNGTAVCTILIQ